MIKSIGVFVLLILVLKVSGQNRFVNPISGIQGKDYRIVNYVDWGIADEVGDHQCLTKTYNGHQGTDFVLRSFKQMDQGVNVVAVDTGIVNFVLDGLYDREKKIAVDKGLGNYVGISHSNKIQTYYGHLRTNSITVQKGDTVYPGQVIGQVGSSGNSMDPHLHFEMWYDSSYYIDPFLGPCGNSSSYWKTSINYDSTFGMWNSSTWDGLPTLDTIREEPEIVNIFSSQNEHITYWSLMSGLRKGDLLTAKWVHEGNEYTKLEVTMDQDWWYYYFFYYINIVPELPRGFWDVEVKLNGQTIDSRTVQLRYGVNVEHYNKGDLDIFLHNGIISTSFLGNRKYQLRSIDGKLVQQGMFDKANPIRLDNRIQGMIILSVIESNGEQGFKRIYVP